MKPAVLSSLLALVSLLGVVGLLWADLDHTSPGPLSRAHAGEQELDGADGCALCHGARGETMDEACASCHAEVEQQIAGSTGLHGTLRGVDARECDECHGEHHGARFDLIGDAAFELAGFDGRAGFDHSVLGYDPAGRHAELACADCHERAELDARSTGGARFLGLDTACTACHEDVHEGRIARACADCHGEERPFAELAAFTHGGEFALDGAHASVACEQCHPSAGAHAVEALAGAQPIAGVRACGDCHEAPHAAEFLAGVAGSRSHAAVAATCAECHAAVDSGFAGQAAGCQEDLHAASGFALDGPHEGLACAACHGDAGEGATFAARYPGRDAGDCTSCHDDPHGGQFDDVLQGGGGCLACHAPNSFAAATFDAEDHARTAFPLRGAHDAVECRACHEVPPEGEVRRFRGAPTDCASCHADPHAGQFADRPDGGQDCAACHDTGNFAQATFGLEEHARTEFPLTGGHEAVGCRSCHEVATDTSVRAFHGTSSRCSNCHADVHGGRFDEPRLPALVAGAEGCARCHGTDTFDAVPATRFEHSLWTGFALDGAHARSDCAGCHAPAPGRRLGPAPSSAEHPIGTCASCHADVHGGLFDRPGVPRQLDGRAGCARCHGTESFRTLELPEFDHASWTGFELDALHAVASCADCHAPVSLPARELGPARGTDCASCHGDPHVGQFAELGRSDCARCHVAGGSLAFDHQRDSRFALDEQHEGLDCSACHRPTPLPGGGSAVRYKPLGLECGDCHGSPEGPVR